MKIKMKNIDHIVTTYIDLGLDMDTNIIDVKSLSVWYDADTYIVLSNT